MDSHQQLHRTSFLLSQGPLDLPERPLGLSNLTHKNGMHRDGWKATSCDVIMHDATLIYGNVMGGCNTTPMDGNMMDGWKCDGWKCDGWMESNVAHVRM